MNPILDKIIKNNFAVILGIFVIYITLILYGDIEKFLHFAMHIDIPKIMLALALIGVSTGLFALRFHRFVRALEIEINIKKSIMIYFFGLAFSITPFNSGTLIKSHILKKEVGSPITKTLPIMLAEKWNELAALVLFLNIFVILHYSLESTIIVIFGTALVLAFLVIARNSEMFCIFKKILSKISFLKKLQENMDELRESMLILTNRRNILESFGLSTLSKTLEVIAVILTFQAIGFNLGMISEGQAYYSGVFLGFISLLPGGLGITEGSMLGLLLKHGGDFALASTTVILVRLVTFWLPTTIGLASMKYFMKEKFSF
ncbi:MAG: UPF0104 family protein [Thaumarchaeota archaeon]|nr:UPF0104 family protein [Nitrososphaerota archaeon]